MSVAFLAMAMSRGVRNGDSTAARDLFIAGPPALRGLKLAGLVGL